MTIEDQIHELAGIIEIGDPDEIIGYLHRGNTEAAAQLLDQNGHIHAAAMNAGKSETLFELAQEIRSGRAQTAPQTAALEAYRRIVDERRADPDDHGPEPDVVEEAVLAAADAAVVALERCVQCGQPLDVHWVGACPDTDAQPLDYHSRCERAYGSTLQALADAGLDTEFIDTGGSCKAITVTGTRYDGAVRTFAGGVYLMLTAGGPLTDERVETAWEVGLYDPGKDTVAVAMLEQYPNPLDKPENDAALAEWLRQIAEVLR